MEGIGVKEPLAHLRQLMREQQVPLQAYIIPTDDAHQVSASLTVVFELGLYIIMHAAKIRLCKLYGH